jgi:catechol 2,3-dioxygenase-like lactoylglutathione lyase family enzyme
MRLDHIAYRVANKEKTSSFFIKCLGYRIAEELPNGFQIEFEDHTRAKCNVLLPPEELNMKTPWAHLQMLEDTNSQEYHKPPEIFVSEGTQGSIVEEWVNKRDGIGGIHHLAYQVPSVIDIMKEWQQNGYAEFTTQAPLTCPGLVQCFTKPSALTGVIYEFIERETVGFCKDNVKDLMNSTKGI